MNKKFISVLIFFTLIILISLIVPKPSMAVSNYTNSNTQYTQSYKSYDINIKVNENNTYDITETFVVHYNFLYENGITRTIALNNSVQLLNGKKYTNSAEVTNISANTSLSQERDGGDLILKIGKSKDFLFDDDRTYILKYTYNVGSDPLKDNDLFYFFFFNFMDETKLNINKISFTITMPKEFDSSNLTFLSGVQELSNGGNLKYTVNRNTINGTYEFDSQQLATLSVALTLPEKYFTVDEKSYSPYYLIIAISLGFVFIVFILWLIFGRDKTVVDTVEFYPPGGYNSAEAAFLYYGRVDIKAVVSLLFYLAYKGYLKIDEIKGSFPFYNNFKITKLKEYDGNNEEEKIFFDGLFSSKDVVTYKELHSTFYYTVRKILKGFNNRRNKKKLYYKKALTARKIIMPMIIILTILSIVKIFIDGNISPYISLTAIVFLLFGIIFPINILMYKNTRFTKTVISIWILTVGLVPFIVGICPIVFSKPIYAITFIIVFISILALLVFRKLILKRTPESIDALGKIKGFRKFLKTAEKEQLDALVEKDPEYFYNILPYTYALGISNKWVKRFEGLGMEQAMDERWLR